MKKQIGTKRYSTESARLLGAGLIDNTLACLYLKKSGEAFLHINPHSEQFSDILPIAETEAETFAKNNGFVKQYHQTKKYLVEPKQPVTVMLPISIVKDITEITQAVGMNQSECLYEMLTQGYETTLKGLIKRLEVIEELSENYST